MPTRNMAKIVGLILALVLPLCLAHQEQMPPDMLSAWASFREAVRERDVDKVVLLSRFPIEANDFGGNIRSPSELKKRYRKIFSPSIEMCFATGHPRSVPGYPGYLIDCDGYLAFGFRKYGSQYKFSYIDNANAE